MQLQVFQNFLLDPTGFVKQKRLFTRFQGCFSQIWILILLILLMLIVLILKLKNVLGKFGWNYKIVDFICKFPFRVFKRCSFQVWAFVAHFVYKESFGQRWVKITEWSIRLENFHFGARFTNYAVFYFVYFEYKKDFWHILVKSIVYVGFLFRLAGLIKSNSI